MSDNVINLNQSQASEPCKVLIDWLEERLAEAKSGKLQGIAGACKEDDGDTYYFVLGWADGNSMLGALTVATTYIAANNQ